MSDDTFKSKYEKYKRKVKLWERDFRMKNGRTPSKHDIRDSKSIRDAYKMYYKLKSSFLENTLSETFDDDGFDIFQINSTATDTLSQNNSMQLSHSLSVSNGEAKLLETNIEFSNLKDINKIYGNNIPNFNEDHMNTEFEAESCNQINENAWNCKLSKNIKTTKNVTLNDKPKITEKLFTHSNFLKRNPRKYNSKSSSQNVLNSTLPVSIMSNEILPDLETILSQKSSQQPPKQILKQDVAESSISNNSISQGWLHRCDKVNNLCQNNDSSIETLNMNITSTPSTFGISNLTNLVDTNIQARSVTDNVIASPNLSLNTTDQLVRDIQFKSVIDQKYASDDNGVIDNSEDDSSTYKLDILHVSKKRKISEENKTKIVMSPQKVSKNKYNEPETDSNIQSKMKRKRKQSTKLTRTIDTKNNNGRQTRATNKYVTFSKNQVYSDSSGADDIDPKNAENEKLKTSHSTKNYKKNINESKDQDIHSNIQEEIKISEEYIPEYGVDTKGTIPQLNINELKQSYNTFEKYLSSTATEAKLDKNHQLKSIPTTNRQSNLLTLQKKLSSGKVNENFVRININKKTFVRGKKTMNFSKYKKKLWKANKASAALAGPEMDMRGCDGGFQTCFNCGQLGHFANKCKIQSDRLLPLADDIEVSSYLSLDQVEKMTKGRLHISDIPTDKNNIEENEISKEDLSLNKANENSMQNIGAKDIDRSVLENSNFSIKNYIGHAIPKDFLEKSRLQDTTVVNNSTLKPLYELQENGSLIDTPAEVYEALKMFDHSSFRYGQEKAIMRILSGLSTLVTLSTGSGKSLCYQLPAYLYKQKRKCISLVISPLVSLMEDQVHGVPHFLNAQCLHTNQSMKKRSQIMEMIKSGEIDILLISPEAVVASEKLNGFGSLLRELPPVAFVCIDEVHCVSQWSHNFRPSYLMICKVLKEKLKIKTILGLTATATLSTRKSIVEHLAIPDGLSSVISDIPLPDNLIITVSKDENRDMALIRLLQEDKFTKFQSIIIYCTRRDECDRITNKIRTYFQEVTPHQIKSSKKRPRIKHIVESYHAGIAASRRKTIQNDFIRGKLKIIVATIAFGMGINKSDIRAVIHYNMPMSFEGYVQEIGRAGRDGKTAHCHLFLDSHGNDKFELKRHVYANSIDRHVIRKLLQKVFVPCSCANNLKQNEYQSNLVGTSVISKKCPGHEVCFSIDQTIQYLDIPEENIVTLLCYMELHQKRYIQVLTKAYRMCKVLSYSGSASLKEAAQNCPPLAIAISLMLKNGLGQKDLTVLEFDVIEIAAAIGWDSGVVKYQLKNLEWTTAHGLPKRSTISVDFYDLGFRVRSPGDLSDNELDLTLDSLHSKVVAQETMQLLQLQNLFDGLSSVAYNSYSDCVKFSATNKCADKLKAIIRNYFQQEQTVIGNLEVQTDITSNEQIISDIKTMIARYPENKFTGRALARIFHGIQSPVYPALIWSRCQYWRAHMKTDFNKIVKLANAEIVKMRT